MSSIRSTLVTAAVALMVVAGAVVATTQSRSVARYDTLPGSAYAVVAQVSAKPGKEQELRQITLPLVNAVRREPNNLLYFLHEDREAPGHFVFYEIFATQADFDAHNATPHVQAWFKKLPELADGGVKVIRMGILGNTAGRPSQDNDGSEPWH
jgi:quinol monooxygenase YgiN